MSTQDSILCLMVTYTGIGYSNRASSRSTCQQEQLEQPRETESNTCVYLTTFAMTDLVSEASSLDIKRQVTRCMAQSTHYTDQRFTNQRPGLPQNVLGIAGRETCTVNGSRHSQIWNHVCHLLVAKKLDGSRGNTSMRPYYLEEMRLRGLPLRACHLADKHYVGPAELELCRGDTWPSGLVSLRAVYGPSQSVPGPARRVTQPVATFGSQTRQQQLLLPAHFDSRCDSRVRMTFFILHGRDGRACSGLNSLAFLSCVIICLICVSLTRGQPADSSPDVSYEEAQQVFEPLLASIAVLFT